MKITFTVEAPVLGWLAQLADYGLHGSTVEEVAETLMRKGVLREVRSGGLIATPPPVARVWPKDLESTPPEEGGR